MTITSLNIADGTVGRKILPTVKRRYVLGTIILLGLIALILVGYFTGIFAKRSDTADQDVLVPPDPTKPLPTSASKLRIFNRAAVCADGKPCAEIGKKILEKNGSAVDATIAAMFCNGVFSMQSMGLAGGFFMTIYKKDEGKAYVLNARETAPINATKDLYKNNSNLSQRGPLAVAVPGELRGYWTAHKKFGKLQWKELVEPTIELCENGYEMSKHQSDSIFKNDIKHDLNLGEWFFDENGKAKKEGSLISPKKLCKTLRLIAENGGDDLYSGTLSKMFLEDLKEAGGIISAQDLKNYEAQWMEPITVSLRNSDTFYSAPPPASGILVGFILNILDGYNFTRESLDGTENTVLTYHRMIEAFKHAYASRTELGDTNFIDIKKLLKNLTSTDYAQSIRQKINDSSTSSNPKDYGAVYYAKEDHGTAHLSVLAENGDAVSVTSSVNLYFGAGLTSKQTGIIFNSVMDDFSFPYFENYFGLPGSPNNEMAPGKRPLSSMSPTIVTDKNGDVKMVVGASGGTKITTAVVQSIMRALWFGDNIKEAVDAPRIHHQLYPMIVKYEYGTLKQVVDGLRDIGHKIHRSSYGSIICALLKQAGKIVGNADFRKGGEVFGIM